MILALQVGPCPIY